MDLQTALNKIYSMHQFDIKLGLERIEKLLEQIGNPQKDLRCIHIAGSNGKGSTASFIASILMEAGFKVGLYTSPHFVKFNERIRINGAAIDDEYIAHFIAEIESHIELLKPTFFEITTALAFKYFQDLSPDYVVLETGLGGRLDATNVISPLASVITSISLEHTNILGEKIGQIAFEKAGIIKKGIPVFVGFVPIEAEEVIFKRASDLKSKTVFSKDFIEKKKDHILLRLEKKQIQIYKTGLTGFHQILNAGLAIKVFNQITGESDISVINKGLMNVVENSGIQGRYEIISNDPRIIFDSAHNPEGIETFIEEFKREYDTYEERILIFGAMKDKNLEVMLTQISSFFNRIYATQPGYERAASIENLKEVGRKIGIEVSPLYDPVQYISEFCTVPGNSCLAVLGSIYLLGEIKSKMIEKKLDKKGIGN
jgi:dihydrofolate synthase/folylpolyglutamate synthase